METRDNHEHILEKLLEKVRDFTQIACPHCKKEDAIRWSPTRDELESIVDILKSGEEVELEFVHADCKVSQDPFSLSVSFAAEGLSIQPIPVVPAGTGTPSGVSQAPLPSAASLSLPPSPPVPQPVANIPVQPPRAPSSPLVSALERPIDIFELRRRNRAIEKRRRFVRVGLVLAAGVLFGGALGVLRWARREEPESKSVFCTVSREGHTGFSYKAHCEGFESAEIRDIKVAFGQMLRGTLVVPCDSRTCQAEIEFPIDGLKAKRHFQVQKLSR